MHRRGADLQLTTDLAKGHARAQLDCPTDVDVRVLPGRSAASR